jgi:hypothetical protein
MVRHKIIWNDFEQHCFAMLAQRAEGRMPRVNRHDYMDVGGSAKQDARAEDRQFGARSDPSKARARSNGCHAANPVGDAIL